MEIIARIASMIVIAIFSCRSATAQVVSPSEVTPQSLRPAAPPSGAGVMLPSRESQEIPAGAENLSVTVGEPAIDGGFPELAAANKTLVVSLRGQRLSVAQIYRAADKLEQAYAAAGFVFARVTIPPQNLTDGGPLHIVVIDGFVEAIDVTGVTERARKVVAARLASLVGQRHIRLSEIERRVLLAGDAPGLSLRSTLVRGAQEGGTRLVVEGTERLVTGSLSADNRLPGSLGGSSVTSALAINSPFGFGEQLYASGTLSPDWEGRPVHSFPLISTGVGIIVPFGVDGWSINPEYASTITHPLPQQGVPANVGRFERFSMRVSDPLIRTRAETFILTGTFDNLNQRSDASNFDTAISHDDYSVLRARVDSTGSLPWGQTVNIYAQLSQGIAGRSQADAQSSGVPLSRQGAAPVFTKFDGEARAVQPLGGAFEFTLIGRAQASFSEPVLTPEGFALDGIESVSGFSAGTLIVDQGATIRGELARLFDMSGTPIGGSIAPYVFTAGGWGKTFAATAAQRSDIHAVSSGLGIRAPLAPVSSPVGLTLGVEAARSYSDVRGLRASTRINLTGSISL